MDMNKITSDLAMKHSSYEVSILHNMLLAVVLLLISVLPLCLTIFIPLKMN